jgi:hypothetical protein
MPQRINCSALAVRVQGDNALLWISMLVQTDDKCEVRDRSVIREVSNTYWRSSAGLCSRCVRPRSTGCAPSAKCPGTQSRRSTCTVREKSSGPPGTRLQEASGVDIPALWRITARTSPLFHFRFFKMEPFSLHFSPLPYKYGDKISIYFIRKKRMVSQTALFVAGGAASSAIWCHSLWRMAEQRYTSMHSLTSIVDRGEWASFTFRLLYSSWRSFGPQ